MTDAFEPRLAEIESRNLRVSADKAWETSLTRKLSIAAITYVVASSYMSIFLHDDRWYVGALVPVIGYLLSTLSLPLIRKRWQSRA